MVSICQHRQTIYSGDVPPEDLIVDFVNTLDVSTAEDALDGNGGWPSALGNATAWTRRDREDVRRLREALRAELLAHHEGGTDVDAARAIDEVVARHPLVMSAAESPRLRSTSVGAGELVASIVDALLTLPHQGRWQRLRVCPAHDCLEAFYDSSRGGTRRWCSMGVCGNRSKVSTYRRRR